MHTVGSIIKDIFPLGTPQYLELPSDEASAHAFRYAREPQVVEERSAHMKKGGETRSLDEFEQDRIRKGFEIRWRPSFNFQKVAPDILDRPELSAWFAPPHDPLDLFAVSGRLLERSGAYHHIEAGTETASGTFPASAKRILQIDSVRRTYWVSSGEYWREMVNLTKYVAPQFPPDFVERHWLEVLSAWDDPIFQPSSEHLDPPDWWSAALDLFAISDEAAKGVGQRSISKLAGETSWIAQAVDSRIAKSLRAADPSSGHVPGPESRLYTLSQANPDSVCVLPKSRTAQIGCTIRNLSHNLALLPAQGVARAAWCYGQQPSNSQNGKPLNLVLIPYPYEIEATCFRQEADSGDTCEKRFGWFSVAPAQIKGADAEETEKAEAQALDSFLAFVDGMIDAMRKDCGTVDILVFPELALSHRVHEAVLERVNKSHGDIEVVVAGLTSYRTNPAPDTADKIDVGGEEMIRRGNFAAITVFEEIDDWAPEKRTEGGAVPRERRQITSYHDKHHRWRLDREQITRYGLGAVLNPSFDWWERQQILSRSLNVIAFRDRATATVLICEDLARMDPAQEVLRAIGPKLIFALLMDGPQLAVRWPARYATVLADDPGSSVLTLTSMALIERSNAGGKHTASFCVGLWRDAAGDIQELKLSPDYQGIGLSLSQIQVTEQTMDGRHDCEAATWILSGVRPLKSVGKDGRQIGNPAWIA